MRPDQCCRRSGRSTRERGARVLWPVDWRYCRGGSRHQVEPGGVLWIKVDQEEVPTRFFEPRWMIEDVVPHINSETSQLGLRPYALRLCRLDSLFDARGDPFLIHRISEVAFPHIPE